MEGSTRKYLPLLHFSLLQIYQLPFTFLLAFDSALWPQVAMHAGSTNGVVMGYIHFTAYTPALSNESGEDRHILSYSG